MLLNENSACGKKDPLFWTIMGEASNHVAKGVMDNFGLTFGLQMVRAIVVQRGIKEPPKIMPKTIDKLQVLVGSNGLTDVV